MNIFFCIDQLTIAQIANDVTTSQLDQITAFLTHHENKLEVHVSMKVMFVNKIFEQKIEDAKEHIQKVFAFGGIMTMDHDKYKELPFTGIFETESQKCTFMVST